MTSVAVREGNEAEVWRAPALVRVALAGCGVVGSALVRELAARRHSLAERHGVEIAIVAVLVRDVDRVRHARIARDLLTDDVDAFLDVEADVVVEAIGGLEPAHRIAESALRRGRKLITANKALLARHGSALATIARRHGTAIRYDAAVGGGVPILRLLDDALGAGTPARVRGILNGTTNYVITRLERGASVEEALAEARAAGFAEEDASRDLDGRDAADKLALVAWAAFGIAPEDVIAHRRALDPDPARYTQLAARVGRVLRQVAECEVVGGELVAVVEPVLMPHASALAQTRDEQNRVEVFTGWSAPLSACGPGAGGLPTATALLSDLVSTSSIPRRSSSLAAARHDLRRARWAVEIEGTPASLHRLVPGGGLVHTDAAATHAWTIVANATRHEIDALLLALSQDDAKPIAARLDDSEIAPSAGCRP
jgi:homoserine dehydrogenase